MSSEEKKDSSSSSSSSETESQSFEAKKHNISEVPDTSDLIKGQNRQKQPQFEYVKEEKLINRTFEYEITDKKDCSLLSIGLDYCENVETELIGNDKKCRLTFSCPNEVSLNQFWSSALKRRKKMSIYVKDIHQCSCSVMKFACSNPCIEMLLKCERGFCYCDISPLNCFLPKSERVKEQQIEDEDVQQRESNFLLLYTGCFMNSVF